MKQRLAGLLLVCLMLGGCGRGGEAVTLNGQALVDALMAEVPFTDQLSKLSLELLPQLYGLEEAELAGVLVYVGTGATAEEIAIFQVKADGEVDADRVKKAVDERLAEQKSSFENYVPGELTKLNDPVIVVKGDYVVLCLSNDNETAKTVIEAAFKSGKTAG